MGCAWGQGCVCHRAQEWEAAAPKVLSPSQHHLHNSSLSATRPGAYQASLTHGEVGLPSKTHWTSFTPKSRFPRSGVGGTQLPLLGASVCSFVCLFIYNSYRLVLGATPGMLGAGEGQLSKNGGPS